MSVERVRFVAAGIAILSTAAAIAVAGLVGFVGLIVPHMDRNLGGGDTKRLLMGCLFVGPALLVGADISARLALNPSSCRSGSSPDSSAGRTSST